MAQGSWTVATELRHEIEPIKGSRFLTTVAPAASREEALAFVARVREEFRDATHNCWAWRTGARGESFQSSDDGEPSGSAGRPILAQLEGHGVTNAAVVVTRWFGGTKLGVGGLVRAYGGAAGKTLDRAELVPLVVLRRVEVAYPYECSGAVDALLAARGLAPVESDYGASVRLVLEVPEEELDAFLRELSDRTAGRAEAST
jgi:uncharacterized YigZ family protein